MGWLRVVAPEHRCPLPHEELHTHAEGSVWVCDECQQIWIVVPVPDDAWGSYVFTRMTPKLRKRYKL